MMQNSSYHMTYVNQDMSQDFFGCDLRKQLSFNSTFDQSEFNQSRLGTGQKRVSDFSNTLSFRSKHNTQEFKDLVSTAFNEQDEVDFDYWYLNDQVENEMSLN